MLLAILPSELMSYILVMVEGVEESGDIYLVGRQLLDFDGEGDGDGDALP